MQMDYEPVILGACGVEHPTSSQVAAGALPVIQNMTCHHVPDVAALHTKSFHGFFLASFGERLLSHYYQSVIDFGQIALVGTNGGCVQGFVTGIDNSFGFYRRLMREKWLALGTSVVRTVAQRPSTAVQILRRLRERGKARTPLDVGSVILTSIAVSPDSRGGGLAHRLMDAFKSEARRRHFTRVYLETDAVANERAVAFYQKEGFSLAREYTTAEGRKMYEFAFELPDS